jgi:hypothetical protein
MSEDLEYRGHEPIEVDGIGGTTLLTMLEQMSTRLEELGYRLDELETRVAELDERLEPPSSVWPMGPAT